jgi:hypothetical protein
MQVPASFEPLLAYADWALASADERQRRRRGAPREELAALYRGLEPWLEPILAACDEFPLGALPDSHRDIYNLALSAAEIAPHIELYKGNPAVPYAFDEARFVAEHGGDETWRGLSPNGRPR